LLDALALPVRTVGWTLEAYRWRREFERELRRGKQTARHGPHDVILVLDHMKPRANAGMLVRSADALGARAVYTVGMTYFNPRWAITSLRSVRLEMFDTMASCLRALREQGYTVYALEPARSVDEEVFLDSVALPQKTAFIVGHESRGTSFSPTAFPQVVWLTIRQFGEIPCLSASVSGSIALYEYARQHGRAAGSR
jgi:tRNA G18 (ribose-2'-O)-methylase SpoU